MNMCLPKQREACPWTTPTPSLGTYAVRYISVAFDIYINVFGDNLSAPCISSLFLIIFSVPYRKAKERFMLKEILLLSALLGSTVSSLGIRQSISSATTSSIPSFVKKDSGLDYSRTFMAPSSSMLSSSGSSNLSLVHYHVSTKALDSSISIPFSEEQSLHTEKKCVVGSDGFLPSPSMSQISQVLPNLSKIICRPLTSATKKPLLSTLSAKRKLNTQVKNYGPSEVVFSYRMISSCLRLTAFFRIMTSMRIPKSSASKTIRQLLILFSICTKLQTSICPPVFIFPETQMEHYLPGATTGVLPV